jgi:hypothetical protein
MYIKPSMMCTFIEPPEVSTTVFQSSWTATMGARLASSSAMTQLGGAFGVRGYASNLRRHGAGPARDVEHMRAVIQVLVHLHAHVEVGIHSGLVQQATKLVMGIT